MTGQTDTQAVWMSTHPHTSAQTHSQRGIYSRKLNLNDRKFPTVGVGFYFISDPSPHPRRPSVVFQHKAHRQQTRHDRRSAPAPLHTVCHSFCLDNKRSAQGHILGEQTSQPCGLVSRPFLRSAGSGSHQATTPLVFHHSCSLSLRVPPSPWLSGSLSLRPPSVPPSQPSPLSLQVSFIEPAVIYCTLFLSPSPGRNQAPWQ